MPDSLLRDLNREHSKMEASIAKMNHHYGELEEYVRQYIEQTTTEWAKLVLNHPKSLLLIVETTRTDGGENEPIRLTTLPLAGGEVWDQLLRPIYSQDLTGSAYHGLTMDDLKDKPRIVDAWTDIEKALEDHHIIIFNADFARDALRSVCRTHLLDDAFCLHNKVKEYYGEFYELSLEKILSYQDIDKKREDLKDSRERIRVLAQIIRNLSTGIKKKTQEPEENEKPLDDCPF